MPTGMVAPSAAPSLPFYQPLADSAAVSKVVVTAPNNDNQFVVYDAWDATVTPTPSMCKPQVQVTPLELQTLTWPIGAYSGWYVTSEYQRGQVDGPGQSGVQVSGNKVGLWLNTMDDLATSHIQAQNGTASLNIGCWYNKGPLPALFPSADGELDVSFDAAVEYDGSLGNAGAIAYFDTILLDCEDDPGCIKGTDAMGRRHAGINLQVSFYGGAPFGAPRDLNVAADGAGTGATPYYIASATIPQRGKSSDWVTNVDGGALQSGPCAKGLCNNTSPPKQCTYNLECDRPVFATTHFHFRISPAQFQNIVNAVRKKVPNDGSPVPSLNLASYGIATLGINGETYDPCKSLCAGTCQDGTTCNAQGRFCHVGQDRRPKDWAQLGLTVSDFRVTSTIPHVSAGVPFGFDGNNSPVVYRDGGTNQIYQFTKGSGSALFSRSLVDAHGAAGDPMGFVAGSAERVVFRGTDNHIYQAVHYGGIWQQPIQDISNVPGAALAAGEPYAFTDGAGGPHIVYRGLDNHIHDVWLDMAQQAWRHMDVTGPSGVLASGDPMGYLHGSTLRVVFRGGSHVYESFASAVGGPWMTWDMTANISGANDTASQPKGALDPDGGPHVIYRDLGGRIHDFSLDSIGWHHADLTTLTNAVAAPGSPMPYLAGSALRVVYDGIADINKPSEGHVHELAYRAGSWQPDQDLTANTRGALTLSSDPMGFVDTDGVARVEYKANDGQLHELIYGANYWLHRDM
jgi:hypothetical protein